MPLYEHVFLARQDVSSQQVEALVEQFKAVIEQGGGKTSKIEPWGLKSLTYRIRKNRKAHMTLLNIDAPASALAEMERQMRLSEDVIRYLTIRVDELEEGPSAMMRKVERDRERDARGGGRFGDREGGGRFGGGGGFGGDRGDRPPRRDRDDDRSDRRPREDADVSGTQE
jgi:small subunit ribosomal protein S6